MASSKVLPITNQTRCPSY